MNTTLQKRIMRRIYYAYALKMLETPGLMKGCAMFVMLVALTHFVSLGNVLSNMMNIQVGHLGTFFYNAITNTEAWTLILLGCLIFTALSFRVSVAAGDMHTYAKA